MQLFSGNHLLCADSDMQLFSGNCLWGTDTDLQRFSRNHLWDTDCDVQQKLHPNCMHLSGYVKCVCVLRGCVVMPYCPD